MDKKGKIKMKTSLDLLNEAIELGFKRNDALRSIDMSLDDALGFENRKPLEEEILSNELYENILDGFKEEIEMKELNN